MQYDSGDEDDKTKNYLKPVIQVTTGKLTITKAVSGLPDSTDVSGQKFSFTVTGKYADGSPVTGAYGCYTFDHEGKTTVTVTGTGSITLTHLPEGIYTVTEDTSNMSGIVDGFRFDSAKYTVGGEETDDVTVSAGSNSAITVTNVYTRNTQTLTVIKTVAGPMGDTSEDNTFSFVLKLKDENNQPYEPDSIGVVEGTSITFNEAKGGYVFTLSHGDKIQFEIPYGYTATVTEDADNGGYTVYTRKYMTEQPPTGEQVGDDEETAGGYSVNSSKSLEETVTQDYTFDFKNFRDVVAPTGLESNHTTPYVLMITAAGMAGLALIGGIVARRIRRRRQE